MRGDHPVEFMRVLFRLVHSLDVRSKRMGREIGVTSPQRLVIRMIGRHPGIFAGELAPLLDLHPSTLTGVLARIEKRGYLRREADPGDRRRARLYLTARGEDVDRRRAGTVEAAVRRALARTDPRRVRLAESFLQRLAAELATHD